VHETTAFPASIRAQNEPRAVCAQILAAANRQEIALANTSISPAERERQRVLVIELNNDELACRILEAYHEVSRPYGLPADQSFDEFSPKMQAAFHRCAMAAMEYFEEQVQERHPVS
jgi:hypothetical protein